MYFFRDLEEGQIYSVPNGGSTKWYHVFRMKRNCDKIFRLLVENYTTGEGDFRTGHLYFSNEQNYSIASYENRIWFEACEKECIFIPRHKIENINSLYPIF